MKKLALTLVAVVYMLSTVGAAVNQFYCCGKLASKEITFFSLKQQHAHNEASGCCKTIQQFHKVNDSHLASNNIFLSGKHFSVLHTGFPLIEFTAPQIYKTVASNNINAPPLISKNPIYIFNCTYRI